MNKFAQLCQAIEKFYHQAMQSWLLIKYAQGFSMPDDPEETETGAQNTTQENELLFDLEKIAHQVSDAGLSSELSLIAEMYKSALQMNAGWNTVYRGISTLLNMNLDDEDNAEQEQAEDVLNEVVRDLRQRAGGPGALNKPDSPQVIAQLKQVKNDFNARSVQEEMNQFDEDQKDQIPEEAVSVLDPFEGSHEGKGRGFGFISRKPLKDWVRTYDDERARYADMLNQPGPVSVNKHLTELVNVLTQLRDNTAKEIRLSTQAASDPALEPELNAIRETNAKLKKDRAKLKDNIKKFELTRNLQELTTQAHQTKDPNDKIRLQQEMALRKLQLSSDLNKREEINLRKILVKSMSGGNMPGTDTLEKMLAKIDEAAQKKRPIKEQRVEEATKIRSLKEAKQLKGLAITLGQKIATQQIVVQQKITDKVHADIKAGQESRYKSYLDQIAAAKETNNEEAIKATVKELQKVINADAKNNPTVKAYQEAKLPFIQFRDVVNSIAASNVLETGEPLDDHIKNQMQTVIGMGKMLIDQHQEQSRIFKTVIEVVKSIVAHLETELKHE